jgi:hypothetical protein
MSDHDMSERKRPSVVIFVGPTLPAADILAAFEHLDLDLTILPPAEQGDILRLLDRLPDAIGMIDGQFFHAPAVLHREIMLALEQGARVLGAASIGALRAAELDVFGMEGVGAVYRLYRSGKHDGDDEVAVMHTAASDGYRHLTEALVTIRHNLGRAQQQGVISGRSAAQVVAALKRLHFTRRTHEAVLSATPAVERPALAAFLTHETVDLKRADALLLLETIARRIAGAEAWPPRIAVEVNQTSHFARYRREYVGQQTEAGHLRDDLVLAFERLLSPTFLRLYRRVTWRCLAVDEAQQRGLVPAEPAALLDAFRQSKDLPSEAAFEHWLRQRRLRRDELLELLGERDLEAQVLALYRATRPGLAGTVARHQTIAHDVAIRAGLPQRLLVRPLLQHPGVPWSEPLVREMKFRGTFGAAIDVASRIVQNSATVFARQPWLTQAPVRRGLLAQLFARRWGMLPERLDAAILARGFAGYEDVAEAARHMFIYDRTAAGTYDAERLSDCFLVDPNARPT